MKKIATLAIVSLFAFPSNAEKRMVSAGFGVTEIIYALQAQDNLIAADFTSRNLIKGDNKKQLGLHIQLSSEGILSLNPTHLIGTNEMGPKIVLEQVKNSGVKVVILPSGQNVPDLLARIDTLAKVTDTKFKAEALKQRVNNDIFLLKQNQCSNKPNVIFFMLDVSGSTKIGGDNTAIDRIIMLAGGNNPAKKQINGYKSVSMESMGDMNPEYILVSQRAWDIYKSADAILDKLPILRSTGAGMKKNILIVPSSALLGGIGLESINLAKELNNHFCKKIELER
ncbi:ABC transporter substrate-binding protein [Photobacterium frigidiphilum]|uniref:heme/hemin ABC transporter substrate-binding protein n=1 Tax=Photobacterium frigidiphilum TaxID=264736 RepID=UPI003D117AC9